MGAGGGDEEKKAYLVQGEMGAAWACVRMQGGDRGRGVPVPESGGEAEEAVLRG